MRRLACPAPLTGGGGCGLAAPALPRAARCPLCRGRVRRGVVIRGMLAACVRGLLRSHCDAAWRVESPPIPRALVWRRGEASWPARGPRSGSACVPCLAPGGAPAAATAPTIHSYQSGACCLNSTASQSATHLNMLLQTCYYKLCPAGLGARDGDRERNPTPIEQLPALCPWSCLPGSLRPYYYDVCALAALAWFVR
jgi:hypothetical protein